MKRSLVRTFLLLLVAGLCVAVAQVRRVRVSTEVQEKHLTKKVAPEYPPLAKKARIQGWVRMQAIIGHDGSIAQLEVISGHPLLVQNALEAARRWQYEPTLLNGEPVEVETTIDVVFALADEPGSHAEKPPPTKAESLEEETNRLFNVGRGEEAVAKARATVAENPEDTEVRLVLARLLITTNRRDEAISELREVLRYKPDNNDIRYMLFTMLLEADRVPEAIGEFHEMRRYDEPPVRAIGQMGGALYRTMRPEAAEAEFRLLVQNHPDPAAAFASLAQELALAGRINAASRLLAEAERLAPNHAQVREMRAEIEQVLDMVERGLELLRARVQQNPREPAARMLMAVGHLLNDEWESRGRDELLAAFELGFDEREGQRILVEMLQRRLGRTAFIAELRGWVRRFPRLPNLHLLLAGTIWESGDRAGGVAELRNAIAAAPQNAALRRELAEYLDALGDRDSAAAERETARSLPPAAGEGAESSIRALAEEIVRSLRGEQVRQSAESANEISAVGGVRTLMTANVMYASTYGGFAPALANLAPPPEGAAPSAQHADLIDPVLASGTKYGYTFTYIVTSTDEKGQPSAFEIYADPVQPGTTGNRYFYTDQSGVIRVSTGGRAGPASPPLQ